MGKRRWYRLATKLNVITISMVLVTVSGLSLLMVRNEFKNTYADLTDHGRILVGMVARSAEYGIYTEDQQTLGSLLDALAMEPDVVFASVVDGDGNSLAERRFGALPRGFSLPGASPFKENGAAEEGGDGTSGRRWKGFIDFNEAVTAPAPFTAEEFFQTEKDSDEKEAIGGVRLVLDTKRARERVRSYIKQVLFFISLLLVVGVAATMLLTRRVVAPIERLKEAAEDVAAGKLDRLVDIRSGDEIADLSLSFNDMVRHLSLTRIQVEERTEELVEANRKMQDEMDARKHLEAQLLHAQKMEAVGHLAGGVAHDFNNILMAIINFATLLKMETGEEGVQGSYVGEIISSAERAAQLTRNLLAFSRKQVVNPEPVDINESVRNVGGMLARIIGEHIEQKIFIYEGDLCVMADRGQMEQLLTNLATNARDAMPQGGELTIQTDRKEFDEDFVKMHGYGKPGSYVMISVSDTGKGMSSEIREKIFEPFFTTKDVDKGTGLGLSIVYGIIKQHGGYIDVYSEKGRGTRFAVYLPLVKAGPAVKISEETAMADLKGRETILLAEDEDKLRAATKTLFTLHGYSVLEAANGEEAVKQFEAHRESIQLLVFDVMMPLKNGKEAYEQIRSQRPDVKIIFMSGYSSKVLPPGVTMGDGIPILMKPVSPLSLLKNVREVLGRGSAGTADPVAGEAEVPPARTAAGKLSGTYHGRVLIAEDNPSLSLAVQKRLSIFGLQVDAVSHGREALEALERRPYDMVLMDIGMPVMGGLETAREIRRRESESGASRLPVLAMTGSLEGNAREESLEAGFDDCLIKPFGGTSINEILTRWLPGGGAQMQGPQPNGGAMLSGNGPTCDRTAAVNPCSLEEIRSLESQGSPGLLSRVVDLYLDRAAALTEEVRLALRKSDYAAMAAAAHELKSSSANVGADQLAALSGELEALAEKGTLEGAAELVVEVQAEHQRVVDVLAAAVQPASG